MTLSEVEYRVGLHKATLNASKSRTESVTTMWRVDCRQNIISQSTHSLSRLLTVTNSTAIVTNHNERNRLIQVAVGDKQARL